jgi:mRNA-degrading endonuclease RelE of RelBE toxin-antitoxin system
MKFKVLFTPEAIAGITAFRAQGRAVVMDVVAERLRFYPTTTSRSGIKRLRSLSKPQYRLGVNEIRVFYDVYGNEVVILAVVPKPEVDAWLAQHGEQGDEENRAV